MDLLLGGFCDAYVDTLDLATLDALERLLEENDNDLYQWISGQAASPPEHAFLLDRIGAHRAGA